MKNTNLDLQVNITGNLAIENTINNVYLEKLTSQSIMITKDQEIDGILEFVQPIVIEDHLSLMGNLHTRYLMGNDLQYWFDNALYTNKGRINGRYLGCIVTNDNDICFPFRIRIFRRCHCWW